jgi:hypothetical protein
MTKMIAKQNARVSTKRAAALALALAGIIGLGCASAKVTSVTGDLDERTLPKPGVILVYNFAVTADDVVEDTFGSQFHHEAAERTEEQEVAYTASETLAAELVKKLQESGINAERANSSTPVPLHAIAVKGQFLSIDEGSRFKRMVIGFGAGSSELTARVQAYQQTQYGLRRLREAEVEASGSKMPGMAVPVAGGAVAGTAAMSVVISGGMNIAKETRGAMNPDAARMAKKIAERAKAFYERQGWL